MIRLQRILFPTDFSESSADALKYACSLTEQFGAELHLLHVLEVHAGTTPVFGGGLALSPQVKESADEARAALAKVLDPAWALGKSTVLATAEGAPFVAIVRYAREHAIDLIVLGTHGRSGLVHAMMGSVAERVVRKATCPVLTVRPGGQRFELP